MWTNGYPQRRSLLGSRRTARLQRFKSVYPARDVDKLPMLSSCGSYGVQISLPLPQSRGECRSHARCRLRWV